MTSFLRVGGNPGFSADANFWFGENVELAPADFCGAAFTPAYFQISSLNIQIM